MSLVDFIIRTYHDAWPPERQSVVSIVTRQWAGWSGSGVRNLVGPGDVQFLQKHPYSAGNWKSKAMVL